jgi:hypothetical protein
MKFKKINLRINLTIKKLNQVKLIKFKSHRKLSQCDETNNTDTVIDRMMLR